MPVPTARHAGRRGCARGLVPARSLSSLLVKACARRAVTHREAGSWAGGERARGRGQRAARSTAGARHGEARASCLVEEELADEVALVDLALDAVVHALPHAARLRVSTAHLGRDARQRTEARLGKSWGAAPARRPPALWYPAWWPCVNPHALTQAPRSTYALEVADAPALAHLHAPVPGSARPSAARAQQGDETDGVPRHTYAEALQDAAVDVRQRQVREGHLREGEPSARRLPSAGHTSSVPVISFGMRFEMAARGGLLGRQGGGRGLRREPARPHRRRRRSC
jgi:hypothetical protein